MSKTFRRNEEMTRKQLKEHDSHYQRVMKTVCKKVKHTEEDIPTNPVENVNFTLEELELITEALIFLPEYYKKLGLKGLPFDTQEEVDSYIDKRRTECKSLYYDKVIHLMRLFPDRY